MVLRKNETPGGEIFSVSYIAESDEDRPVTFVFNGGPWCLIGIPARRHRGSATSWTFPADGSLPAMPAQLADNEESWIGFSRPRLHRSRGDRLQQGD